MTVSNSATDIVNLALDVIKTENINDVMIPDGNKIAVVANRWYDDLRQDALEGFPWNFATKLSSIPLSDTSPDFGFTDAYVLPNDYLSLNYIEKWNIPLSRWNYVIQVGEILIDNGAAESLDVGYTFDQQVVTKFSPSFKQFLAHIMAEKIVYKLTGNVSLQNRVTASLKTAELNAKAKNGKANPPVAYRESRILQGRRVYAGAAGPGLFARRNGRI